MLYQLQAIKTIQAVCALREWQKNRMDLSGYGYDTVGFSSKPKLVAGMFAK